MRLRDIKKYWVSSMYDYLIVGAGLFGAVFAQRAIENGKTCLVIDKRNNIGGNIYTENTEGINIHKYGAHIFHTSYEEVWAYINRFAEFNDFVNSPKANYNGEIYSMPFNMHTFNELWGVETAEEAKAKIEASIQSEYKENPENLEEQAINLVGREVYEKLVKGYTEKQWGHGCKDLPAFIIKRLPLRFTYDNNYFNDKYQGIPVGGYTDMVEKMLDGADIRLGVDYFKENFTGVAKKTVFTGRIDEFYGFKYGRLDYRSLNFETEILEIEDFQGNAVINYTDRETPFTRIIEHKHFEEVKAPKTVITREYPATFNGENEPYYPVNDDKNNALYMKYKILSEKEENVIFGGRLGTYSYLDMDDVIKSALECAQHI